jgi:hypothetical protein
MLTRDHNPASIGALSRIGTCPFAAPLTMTGRGERSTVTFENPQEMWP